MRVSHNKTIHMDANTILHANILDILFDGRNKSYGAYELRKSYNKRIMISVATTISLIGVALLLSAIGKSSPSVIAKSLNGPDIIIKPPPLPVKPPPLPPVLPPPPHVATIAFPPPIIVKDNLVIKPPPEIQELIGVRIDLKTTNGYFDSGMVLPPQVVIDGSQVLATPLVNKIEDTVFRKVEIDATFPGGANAWSKYVSRAIERGIDEFTEKDYGTCIVQFIVDKTGKVSNVEATSMKGSKLAEIATNAIRNGPNWTPAQQNGNSVKAFRTQPVTFKNVNQ